MKLSIILCLQFFLTMVYGIYAGQNYDRAPTPIEGGVGALLGLSWSQMIMKVYDLSQRIEDGKGHEAKK